MWRLGCGGGGQRGPVERSGNLEISDQKDIAVCDYAGLAEPGVLVLQECAIGAGIDQLIASIAKADLAMP